MLGNVVEVLEGRWWIVAGVGVVALVKGARPAAKGVIKGYLAARDGLNRLTSGSRAGLRHLYEEAEAEYHHAATDSPAGESGGALRTAPAAAAT